MKPFKSFAALFGSASSDPELEARRAIHREWDRQRALAISPADRAEIDAIFSRAL
jgi:hypothetical protein